MGAGVGALRLSLALLAVLAAAGGAQAHAVVLETTPADGALLETAPGEVSILFNEPISPVRAQVLDASGADITPAGAVTLDGPVMRIDIPDGLQRGSYIASYRVVSGDSHPIAGSVVFSVGQVSDAVAASTTPADDTGWRLAMASARALVFAGLLGGAGGTIFIALVLPVHAASEQRVRRTVFAIAALGGVAAIIAMAVQGGLLLNGPASSIIDPATWGMGITSHYGRTASATLIGLALVAIGLRGGARRRGLAWLGAAIALGGFGLSGHIVGSGPAWLTFPTLIAHTSAAAFWAGSLLPLRQVLGSGDRAAPMIVERFSRLAMAAVGILLLAGLIIALLQAGSFDALFTTGYGIALSAKLLLVAVLIAVATWNKLRLNPPLMRGRSGSRAALQRTILAELVLVGGILGATGFLGTRPPPRVLAEGAAHAAHFGAGDEAGLVLTIIQASRSAEIELASSLSGVNVARVTLSNPDGSRIEPQEVSLIASNPGAGVEPIVREAEPAEDGTWRVENLLLAPAGRWTLRLDVLISDFENAILETRTDLFSRQPPPLASAPPD